MNPILSSLGHNSALITENIGCFLVCRYTPSPYTEVKGITSYNKGHANGRNRTESPDVDLHSQQRLVLAAVQFTLELG